MSIEEKIYTRKELIAAPKEKIVQILATKWGMTKGDFEVFGVYRQSASNAWGYLIDARSTETGLKITYPLEELSTSSPSFWVSPSDASILYSIHEENLVSCRLQLSSMEERKKHSNPLEMSVKTGSIKVLSELPENIPLDIIENKDKRHFISKSTFVLFEKQAEKKLLKRGLEANAKLERELDEKKVKAKDFLLGVKGELENTLQKQEKVEFLVADLDKSHTDLVEKNETLEHEILQNRKKMEHFQKDVAEIETKMTKKLERLKAFISEKSDFLETFEFADREDLDAFFQNPNEEVMINDGLSFKNDLNSNYELAVSYIQAHMVESDILYSRHIIENYITLLRTQDLVILAGDSGSGKSNLVKSFASAVGGKAVIIPVKPNWTSSEDLLGYYNPLEKKYLSSPFLDALLEAKKNPHIPYFVCLDEMNLARVEYYFADFLSLMETRTDSPEITLFSDDESSHVLSELKAVEKVIFAAQEKYSKKNVIDFVELMKDEELNTQIRKTFGFSDKESLVKYHGDIRRMLTAVLTVPSRLKVPANVHIVGTVNIDETTHYLSPKILDRAHIMRFQSPLLADWDEILNEVDAYAFEDISKPLLFEIEALGARQEYPKFDRESDFCKLFVALNREFFHKLGVEFGMRTIRQGLNYMKLFSDVNDNEQQATNNFLLHKVLPKFSFDGNKMVGAQSKLDLLDKVLHERMKEILSKYESFDSDFSSVQELEDIVENAKSNDGVVNYWSK